MGQTLHDIETKYITCIYKRDQMRKWITRQTGPKRWFYHSLLVFPRIPTCVLHFQVELVSKHPELKVEVRHIIKLQEDTLSSYFVVSNSKFSPIQLMGTIISHLTVSTPEATYAYGLGGSNFFRMPMFLSEFSIVPPDSGGNRYSSHHGVGLRAFFPGWGERNEKSIRTTEDRKVESREEIENEETDDYKVLTDPMSRIYTYAPRNFTIIDRVGIYFSKHENIYTCSPGA